MLRFAPVLLAACIPINTSTSTTMSSSSPPPAPAAAPAGPAPANGAPSMAGGQWFVSHASASSWGPERAVPVSEGTWLDAQGKPVVDTYGGRYVHAMRTQPATLQTLPASYGRPIIARCGQGWYLIAPESRDEAGTITVGNDGNEKCPRTVPIADLRVIVEFKILDR